MTSINNFIEQLKETYYGITKDSFNEFTTVDWVHDLNKARERRYKLKKLVSQSDFKSKILSLYEAAQSWIVVLLVGVAIGTSAAFIDIAAGWLADVKLGYCKTHWYFNQKFCCWENEDAHNTCKNWIPWGSIAGEQLDFLFNWIAYIFICCTLAFLSALIVTRLAPTAAGSGIPQIKTILGGFLLPNFLGKSTLLIKMFGLILAVSSGLSLGKEGPSVHLACCIGDMISKWFPKFRNNQAKIREILSASSAAGVAVAFGSPIGGVLYSLEELSTHFPMKTLWRSFFSALVATVILHAFNPFRTGKIVLFMVSNDKGWKAFEILIFAFIGLSGGLYGVLTIKMHRFVAAYRSSFLKHYKLLEVLILAFLTAVICYPNIFLRIDMSEAMSILFKECSEQNFHELCKLDSDTSIALNLLWATLLRTILVIITYGCEVPTGIFIPSMAIGAYFGRAVGILVRSIYKHHPTWLIFSSCANGTSCINPGTYAFLGAAAALCGVTKMTVTVVVIMFELTGASEFILPTMITVFFTKAVGDIFHHGGIADQAIWWKGFPYMEEETSLNNIPVHRVMCKLPRCIPITGWKLKDLELFLDTYPYTCYPVVNNLRDPKVEGFISRVDLEKVLDLARKQSQLQLNPNLHCFFTPRLISNLDIMEIEDVDNEELPSPRSAFGSSSLDFGSYVDPNPFIVHPKLPLEILHTLFRKIGPHLILIELNGKLIGLVTKKDVLHYQRQMELNEHLTFRQNQYHYDDNFNNRSTLKVRILTWLNRMGCFNFNLDTNLQEEERVGLMLRRSQ